MALGSLISIKKKIAEKNLSWVADLGWLVAIVAMYLLSLYLVIGESINITPVFAMIGVAFLLVVLFGAMSPDRTFVQGLKAGLADAFTVFLNTISCFGNVMSYIRLFAVGMAGLAISQSFNGIAAGFHGPLIILAVVVVLIGHGLNIIMCFLSVVVHGVRLNVLECRICRTGSSRSMEKVLCKWKTGTVHHDRVRWSTSYTDNLRIPSYELYQISSRRRSRRRTGTWCWYLLWTRNRTFSIIPG